MSTAEVNTIVDRLDQHEKHMTDRLDEQDKLVEDRLGNQDHEIAEIKKVMQQFATTQYEMVEKIDGVEGDPRRPGVYPHFMNQIKAAKRREKAWDFLWKSVVASILSALFLVAFEQIASGIGKKLDNIEQRLNTSAGAKP